MADRTSDQQQDDAARNPESDEPKAPPAVEGFDEATLQELADGSSVSDAELLELGLLDAVQARRNAPQASPAGETEDKGEEGQAAAGQPEPEPTGQQETKAGTQPAAEAGAAGEGDAGQEGEDEEEVSRQRFERMRRQRDESRQALQRMEERIDALHRQQEEFLTAFRAGQQHAGQAGEPAKPQDPIAAIDAQLDELADKFDGGELSQRDYERAKRQLEDQRWALKLDQANGARQGRDRGQEIDPETGESLVLRERSEELARQNAWFADLTYEEVESLANAAHSELAREGRSVRGEAGLFALRQRAAEIGKRLGWHERAQDDDLDDAGHAPQASPQRRQQQTTQPSTMAASGARPPGQDPLAQRREKLAMAGRQPPDIATAPPAPNAGSLADLGDDQVVNLSQDQLAALPDSAIEALLRRAGGI